ncbi:uncharacterized protein LOC134680883 isoform X1 [Mytilus trossulus]|uniref:uncharacterized protein LOC134680883 isoform X1 n=1 Tax=Mytilus trossulus TaxID=6551 RepID=UPI0030065E3D
MIQCRVFPVLVLVAVYMFSFIGESFGRQIYGNCEKYAVMETKPILRNGDRFCITEGRYVYCKEFACTITKCFKPVVPYHGCPYCEGTCSYGGAVYQINDAVLDLDGANGCTCHANNGLICTKIGSSPKQMCLKKHRLE